MGHEIPVYGKGQNIEDWIHVDDHVEAILLVIQKANYIHTILE